MAPYALYLNKAVFKQIRKGISIIILAAFVTTSVKAPAYAQIAVDPMPRMPLPGVMVHLSPDFTPAILQGLVIHPDNGLKFDFIVKKGEASLTDTQKKQEYTKLIKYFLASLAVPDEDQWVNLSPYEKDRIIKDDFGKTEMGRDLLAEDYILKQITASLIYPEDSLGKKFWNEVYEKAYKQYGTTNIPVNTFNKVWILPDSAELYEKGNAVFLIKSHLKVMMEEDYLSLQKHAGIQSAPGLSQISQDNKAHSIASKIVKEIVIPQLETEVNEGKNFATVRQAYSGMILAAWYKRALKESLLGRIYANKSRVKGVDQDPKTNQEIFRQYLKAYKKGVFNFIKEDVDKYTNETIPRKYFSGGLEAGNFPEYAQMVPPARGEPASRAMISDPDDEIVYSQEDEEAAAQTMEEFLAGPARQADQEERNRFINIISAVNSDKLIPTQDHFTNGERVLTYSKSQGSNYGLGVSITQTDNTIEIGLTGNVGTPSNFPYHLTVYTDPQMNQEIGLPEPGVLANFQDASAGILLQAISDRLKTDMAMKTLPKQITKAIELLKKVPATAYVNKALDALNKIKSEIGQDITSNSNAYTIGGASLLMLWEAMTYYALKTSGNMDVFRNYVNFTIPYLMMASAVLFAGILGQVNKSAKENLANGTEAVNRLQEATAQVEKATQMTNIDKAQIAQTISDALKYLGDRNWEALAGSVAVGVVFLAHVAVLPSLMQMHANVGLTHSAQILLNAYKASWILNMLGLGTATPYLFNNFLKGNAATDAAMSGRKITAVGLVVAAGVISFAALKSSQHHRAHLPSSTHGMTLSQDQNEKGKPADAAHMEMFISETSMEVLNETDSNGNRLSFGYVIPKDLGAIRFDTPRNKAILKILASQNVPIPGASEALDDINNGRVTTSTGDFDDPQDLRTLQDAANDGTAVVTFDSEKGTYTVKIPVTPLGNNSIPAATTVKPAQTEFVGAADSFMRMTSSSLEETPDLKGGTTFVYTGTVDGLDNQSLQDRLILEILAQDNRVNVPGAKKQLRVKGPKSTVFGATENRKYILSLQKALRLGSSKYAGISYNVTTKVFTLTIKDRAMRLPNIGAVSVVLMLDNGKVKHVGGIDFNSANLNLQIKRDGKGVPLPISQQNLGNIKIDGLVPVILDIKPAASSSLMSQFQASGV